MDLFYIVLCGLLGTSAMSFVMWFITKEGIANKVFFKILPFPFSVWVV